MLSTPKLKDYWINQKKQIPPDQWDSIDWDAHGRAMERQKESRQHWVTKHATGFCSVGKNIGRWSEDRTTECPRCGAENESTTHVWQCHDPRALTQWDKSLDALRVWMIKSDTSPEIRNSIIIGIRRWRDGKPLFRPRQTEIRQVNDAQALIGWENVLRGRLSLQWREFQRR